MNKVTTLTDEMYNKIKNTGKLGKEVRELLGIPQTKKMRIGDTAVLVGTQCQQRDVFKATHEGSERYYVVIEPMDDKMAFCIVIYPCSLCRVKNVK